MSAPRPAVLADLGTLTALAERCEADPRRATAYVSSDAASIESELAALEPLTGPVDGTGDRRVDGWVERTTVLVGADDDHVIGWVLADTDRDLGRVWWWGPFVDPDLDDDSTIAACIDLLVAARTRLAAALPGIGQQEVAFDERATALLRAAAELGLVAEEGSDVLVLAPGGLVTGAAGDSDPHVVELEPDHADAVATLHDATFPGTHTTGARLVQPAPDRRCWVAVHRGDDTGPDTVDGYVAVEVQSDGSWYLDFLGVDPGARRRGIGARLVRHVATTAFERRATAVHLTVRAGNTAARALYRSLGFVSERVLVPCRHGFSLADAE